MTFIVITNRSIFFSAKWGKIIADRKYFLQIGAIITNWCKRQVYIGRVIFIEIEDHNYEFLNKQLLQYPERQCDLDWSDVFLYQEYLELNFIC